MRKITKKWIRVKNKTNFSDPAVASKLDIAKTMTLELMELHGVSHLNFKWNHCLKSNGKCNSTTISLSVSNTLSRNKDDIKNTILHEIAHALVGAGHGHREKWQTQAKALGVSWKRRYHK